MGEEWSRHGQEKKELHMRGVKYYQKPNMDKVRYPAFLGFVVSSLVCPIFLPEGMGMVV